MALGSQPRWTVQSAAGARADVDVGLRDYMLRIYNYMASGLALTGIVAYVAAYSGFIAHIYNTPITEIANCRALEPIKMLTRPASTMPISPMNRKEPNRDRSRRVV